MKKNNLQSKPSIAFVYDAIYPYVMGGAERRIYELANALKKDFNVNVVGMKFWDGNASFQKDGITYHGVCKNKNMYKNERRSITEAIRFAFGLGNFLRKNKFDVMEVQNFPYLHIFPCLFLKGKGRLIIYWHEFWGRYWFRYLGFLGVFGILIEKTVIFLGKEHWANSDNTKESLRKCTKKEVKKIPLFIDFKNIERVIPSKEKYDFVFVGRLIREKNVMFLVRLMKNFRDKKLAIVGDGPEKDRIFRAIKYYNLSNVYILGGLGDNDKFSIMKSSRLFVFPSSREGFGIAVLEAMACGLPVVTLEHPQNAAKELVGKNGIICRKDKFEESIRIILNNPKFYDKSKKIANEYNISRIRKQIVDELK